MESAAKIRRLIVNGVQGRNLESGKVKALAEHINADDNFVPPIFDGFDHRMPARRTAVNKDRGTLSLFRCLQPRPLRTAMVAARIT